MNTTVSNSSMIIGWAETLYVSMQGKSNQKGSSIFKDDSDHGLAWWYGMIGYGMIGYVYYGMTWHGMLWYVDGMVWDCMVWDGMVWYDMYMVWDGIV